MPQSITNKIISLDEYRRERQFVETRTPWREFQSVFVFAPLNTAKKHPLYINAKQGNDVEASLRLVRDIVNDNDIKRLREAIGSEKVMVVPVQAIEEFGVNKIPAACAYHIATKLEYDLCGEIVQINMPKRTDKGAYYRLSHYPLFDGGVEKGKRYIIVDDTLTMGGTLASLRGFIENGGGHVVLAATLTGHPGAVNLNITPNMLDSICRKHGSELNDWWKNEIGFGVDKLTQGEAGHIKKAPSLEEIRSRISQSRLEK